jgi:quercetin dioxygenase-like cupin family protein
MSNPEINGGAVDNSTVVDLAQVGRALLEQARDASNGHASRLVIGGDHQRAVLMALTDGSSLGEHESPPAATLHLLSGQARLYAADGPEWILSAGQVVAIPPARHGVTALEDSVMLLTVALAPAQTP